MTDDTRRHWHGSPGDRHEHHNVWVQGGPKSQTTRAAWALTPEMIANMQQRRVSIEFNSKSYTIHRCSVPS